MCGRFYIDIDDSELQDIVRTVQNKLNNPEIVINTGEIKPTHIVPVQTQNGYEAMKWGFKKHYASGYDINARSETALEKRTFSKSMQERRCLIPASNYFEWENLGSSKQKYSFYCKGTSLFHIAGCYRFEKDSLVPTFVILTRDAAEDIKHIHDRMPVIIPNDKMHSWLNESPSVMNHPITSVQTLKV